MYGLTARCAVAVATVGIFLAGRAVAADKTVDANNVTKVVNTMHHSRVSTVEDLHVRNAAGEDIGKIKDLVIDINSGKVIYAALDFGGFLGIGDKLFAVPWHSLTVKGTDKDQYLVLDVTKEKLKDAPGFDKNHWPDMANPTWGVDVDRFYGPAPTATVR